MAPRRTERLPALLTALLLAAPAAAQGPIVDFTTPDGSRFVLAPDAATPQLHWAIASPIDASHDPAGREGLAATTLQISLSGTWRTGSRDAARERDAMARLDAAWQRMLADPRDVAAAAEVRRLDTEVRELADPQAFVRVLAAAPAFRPEVQSDGDVGLFVLTTLPEAVGAVGRLLVERRDEQALRDLPRTWLATFGERLQRFQQAKDRALHAEVLALALPDHPAARLVEAPVAAAPAHAQAMAVWAATQHPSRTVHVLLGNFDVAATRRVLEATFTRTSLPPVAAAPTPPARPLAGLRRSLVGGVPTPTVAIAWVLPADADRFVLATAVQWLAAGPGSQIGGELARQGRQATIRARAPWPGAGAAHNLLLLEASDPAGVAGLADLVLAVCADAARSPALDPAVQQANAALQRSFAADTADARQLAMATAAAALAWPRQTVALHWPERIEAKAIQDLLARTFAWQPVIVEGRP